MDNKNQLQALKEKLAALPLKEREALLARLKTPAAPATNLPALAQQSHALTAAQQRLWTLEQFDRAPYLYHIPLVLSLPANIDKEKVKTALKHVVMQHVQLNSFFIDIEGAVEQHYANSLNIDIAQISLEHALTSPFKIQASHALADFFLRPFAFNSAPLFRVALATAPDAQYLLICCHHLIMDAWSANLFLQQFITHMQTEGHDAQEVKRDNTYADYVLFEKEQINAYQRELIYWENKLAQSSWHVDLVNDYPRPKYLSGKGDNELLKVPDDVFAHVIEYAKINQVSVNHVVLSVFQLLLSRYSNQDDITLGLPIAGRDLQRWQKTIGLFVNTCLHARKINYQASFQAHLLETKNQLLEDLAHAAIPYDQLISHFYRHKLCAQGTSFNVLYNFIQTHSQADISLCLLPMSKFDISLHVLMSEDDLTLLMEYSTDLFFKETICQLINDLLIYLKTFIANDQRSLNELIWSLNNHH